MLKKLIKYCKYMNKYILITKYFLIQTHHYVTGFLTSFLGGMRLNIFCSCSVLVLVE